MNDLRQLESILHMLEHRKRSHTMPKHFTRAFLTVSFALTVFVAGGFSPEAAIPPVSPAGGGVAIPGDPANSAEATRIVEGRPGFYWMKRNLHPISWIEAMARPP